MNKRQKFFLKDVIWWAIVIFCFTMVTLVFKNVIKNKFFELLAKFLSTNVGLLANMLFYVFILCSVVLVVIVHWVGWDNIKFRFQQRKYRSKLVCKDYYKQFKEIKLAQVLSDSLNDAPQKQQHGPEGQEKDKIIDSGWNGYDRKGTSIFFRDGKLNGIFNTYYSNNKLESEISYRDGKLDGVFKTFYRDGKLHNEKCYKEGKLDGVFKAYDEDGSIFFEITYKDNKQHGMDKTYYRNGVVEYEDFYEKGKMVSRRTYDEIGRLLFDQDHEV